MRTLDDWLQWQQTLHPRAIDLGLERVRRVAERMGLLRQDRPVITVGGTNGKGSCVAYLEAILASSGYRVGAYTSPHILRYNERIRIDRREVEDAVLVGAFERVDQARGDVSLTYFEFGTLAAFDLFDRAGCDCWVLEVGLGGRLDAVNVIDADVAVLTSVGLDHTDWLGPDRESIGREKAGIFRPGRVAVYGEPDMPQSVAAQAAALGAQLWWQGRDYGFDLSDERWCFRGPRAHWTALPRPALLGSHQFSNAAAALAALQALSDRLPVSRGAIEQGLSDVRLAGRFHVLPGEVEWVLDVAHNRDGVACFADALRQRPPAARTYAVFAQMQRKELEPVLASIAGLVDAWWLLQLPDADARPASEVAAQLAAFGATVAGRDVPERLLPAVDDAAKAGDRVLAFGSFRTVEEALRYRSHVSGG
jgi:dihydrofolate synthase/folylpolyglutamate synthase